MKTEKKLKLLGTIKSNIVGVQYYDTLYQEGDIVYFDRNPYNEYDENAIEVSNDCGILGHLKRQNSVWLGELIDEGKIFLKGKISEESDHWRIPIEIEVYHTKKGSKILKPLETDSAESVIHNHLLDIFKNSGSYSRETILALREYYKGIIHSKNILPETTLIFKLLKNSALENQVEKLRIYIDNAQEYFKSLEYGKPIREGGITVLPLIKKGSTASRYVSGAKALKDKTLIIEEIGENGEVSRLRATNRGNKPVILVGGEGLKGAKQDRIVNVTVIIEVNQRVDIPVSCVEHGRWSYRTGRKFKSANFATQSIRKSVREDAHKNLKSEKKSYESNQDKVWQCVAEAAEKYEVNSRTGNLNEVYHAKKADIDKVLSKIKYVKDAVGVAIFANGRQVSVELFQEKALMRANWKKIMQSVIIDEYNDAQTKGRVPTASKLKKQIKELLNQVCSAASEPEQSPGRGNYIVSSDNRLEAGMLFDNQKIVHLSGVLSDEYLEVCNT